MSARDRLDDLMARRTAAVAPGAFVSPAPRTLAEVLGGGERCCARGACWQVVTPIHQLPAQGEPAPQDRSITFAARTDVTVADRIRLPASATEIAEVEVARAVLLDIETGGFAGTPVFLVGAVPLGPGPAAVVQLLARDYPEEEFILRVLAELLGERDVWISFNGKAFDEPFLRDRATLHRVPLPVPRLHIDLLPAARRAWKHALPNCRLGTLEREILGRTRVGDVPSADVPDLFHHFMRTGHASPLRPVLEHNRDDLVSCLELLGRLSGSPAAGSSATIPRQA